MDDEAGQRPRPAMLGDQRRAGPCRGENAGGGEVIAGNEQVFSSGFDLKVFRSGDVRRRSTLLGRVRCRTGCCRSPSRWWRLHQTRDRGHGLVLACSVDRDRRARVRNFQANGWRSGWCCPTRTPKVRELRLTPSTYQRAVRLALKVFFGETALAAAGWVDGST